MSTTTAPITNSLAELLLECAELSDASDLPQIEDAIDRASEIQQSLIVAVLDTGDVTESDFMIQVGNKLGMQWMGDSIREVSDELREKFPVRIALRYHLLPQQDEDSDVITILTYDPFDYVAKQMVSSGVDGEVRWALATRRQIIDNLRQGYGVGAETFEELLAAAGGVDNFEDIKQETTVLDLDDDEASVVKFVNQIMREALEERATDIHIEPLENDLRIRYRIDGMLHEIPVSVTDQASAILSALSHQELWRIWILQSAAYHRMAVFHWSSKESLLMFV